MDTQQVIDQAQAPGTFDVLSFIEQTAYPTDKVVVFQDVKSVDALLKANRERLDHDAAPESFDPTELDARIAELSEKVQASAIVFELRGMPPGIVQEIYGNGEGTEEELLEREHRLIAATIIAASDHKGNRDERLWQHEDVAKLRRYLKEGEFGKLINGVVKVNFNATVFDEATDAGFLSRGSDLA